MSDITDGLINLLELAQSEERMARLDWLEARRKAQELPRKEQEFDHDYRFRQALVWEPAYRRYKGVSEVVNKIRGALRAAEEVLASL